MLGSDKTEEKKLVPLRRFAQDGQYTPAYLSILVQRKKLKAKKIGRNFFTSKEWFDEYLEKHAREAKRVVNESEQNNRPSEVVRSDDFVSTRPEQPIEIEKVIEKKNAVAKKENKQVENIFSFNEDRVDFSVKENNFLKNKIFNFVSSVLLVTVLFISFAPSAAASFVGAMDRLMTPIINYKKIALSIGSDFYELAEASYRFGQNIIFKTDEGLVKNLRENFLVGSGEFASQVKKEIISTANDFVKLNLFFSEKIDLALKKEKATGQVAGVKEINSSQLAKEEKITTGIFDNIKWSLQKLGDKQVELSLFFGKKLEGTIKEIAVSMNNEKIMLAGETIGRTNDNMEEYNKGYLAAESDRSLGSLKSIYASVIDFILPEEIKERYSPIKEVEKIVVEKEFVPYIATSTEYIIEQKEQEIDREEVAKIVNSIVATKDTPKPETIIEKTVVEKVEYVVATTSPVVVNNYTNNNYYSSAPSEPSNNFSTLTTNDLVVNNGGEIKGNLKVGGSVSANYLSLSNLGVDNLISGRGISAGKYGLASDGDVRFNGENNYISGVLNLSNILNIDYSSAMALAVGDGASDTFTVNTSQDSVTINGVNNIYANSTSPVLIAKQSGAGNILGLYSGASEVFTVSNNGWVGIGIVNPSGALDVGGSICFNGDCKTSWADVVTTAGYWSAATGGIHYSSGNIGIGTTTAPYLLTIGNTVGDQFLVNSSGAVVDGTWQGDVINSSYLPNTIIFQGNNISLLNNDSGYITSSTAETLINKTWNGDVVGVAYGGTGLDSIANNEMIYGSGINTYSTTTITSAGRAFLDDADDVAQRTTLGLGSMSLESNTGSTTINTLGTITTGTWNSNVIDVAYGGTGNTAFATGSIPFFNGSILTEDNSRLYWDDANKRFSVGTNSPRAKFHILGSSGTNAPSFLIESPLNEDILSIYPRGGMSLTNYANRTAFYINQTVGNQHALDITGNIHIAGNIYMDRVNIDSSPYNVSASDVHRIHNINVGSGATINLPSDTATVGDEFIFHDAVDTSHVFDAGAGYVIYSGSTIGQTWSSPDYFAGETYKLSFLGSGTWVVVESSDSKYVYNSWLNQGVTTNDSPAFSNLLVGMDGSVGTELLELYRDEGVYGGGVAMRIHSPGVSEYKIGIPQSEENLRIVNTNALAPGEYSANGIIIDPSGNVGIGTTTIPAMLTVGATTGSQLLVNSSGVITDGVWQGDVIGLGYGGTGTSTSFTAGSVLFSDGSSLAQDNSNFYWDNTNKRLGIGRAPTYTLDISNSLPSVMIDSSVSTAGAANFWMKADRPGDGGISGLWRIYNNGATPITEILGYRGSTDLKGDLVFKTSDTERTRIDEDGNIGIGTSSPSSKLHLSGGFMTLDNNYGLATLRSDAVAAYLIKSTTTDNTDIRTMKAGASILFSDNNSNLLGSFTDLGTTGRLYVSGDVGIGTTTPSEKLHVSSGNILLDNAYSIRGARTDLVTSKLLRIDTNDYLELTIPKGGGELEVEDANANVMMTVADLGTTGRLYVSGDVGIGTTTPSSMLTVGATTGSQLLVNSSGVVTDGAWNGDVIGMGYGGTGTSTTFSSGSIVFSNGSSLAQNNSALYWDNTNSRLGIGVSNPSSKLSIHQDLGIAGTSNMVVLGNTSANTGYFAGQSSTRSVQMFWAYNGNPANAYGLIGTYGFSNDLHIAAKDIIIKPNGTEVARFSGSYFGIGTSTPAQGLHVGSAASGKNVMVANGGLCVDDDDNCVAGFTPGAIIAKSSNLSGADYAEYFYTVDTDLESGEVVCVDVTNDNAVKRCSRGADDNVMGIVSSDPSIVGNAKDHVYKDAHYKIIGMLGQVPARVSAENGPIRPGDSLTSASSTPGYAMRAEAGDPTVGVALEKLDSGTGNIQVLISRRNKSLTVETIEQQITDRIAAMEIQDEVDLLVSNAVDSLNIDQQIAEVVNGEVVLLDAKLTIEVDNLSGQISYLKNDLDLLINRLVILENNFSLLDDKLSNFVIGDNGEMKIGGDLSVGPVAVVEINASSSLSAFVVRQEGDGDLANFYNKDVEIMNIGQAGRVTIVGEMMVDGRIMVCSGGACGDNLDMAVDETMGDIGVEGKVVAGAFEGYCDDGWVWVPGVSKYGTMPGFCVMQNEASESLSGLPESNASSSAWTDLSQGEAQLACQSLGAEYHLISENEWLTIANSIIRVADNDIDQVTEGLQLATFGSKQFLTNYGEINNLVGGVSEWTDQVVTVAGLVQPVRNIWQEYYDVIDYNGFNIAPPYYYSSANGIGKIFTGDNQESLRGFVRGQAGIYDLDLSNAPTFASSTIGFRCAK